VTLNQALPSPDLLAFAHWLRHAAVPSTGTLQSW